MNRRTDPQYAEVDGPLATPCWQWQWFTSPKGYGKVWSDGGPRLAYVVYWKRINGPVPDGLELDHLCRNRGCVNPAHLEPVTHEVNGQRGANARLTAVDVRAIRAAYSAGGLTHKQLGARYGVDPTTISHITRRKTWRNVEPAPARA